MSQLNDLEFADHTAAAMLLAQPKTGTVLIWSIALFVILLIAWSLLFEIDETVRGQGKAVPSRHVQIIQNLEGGILDKLDVQEGQLVKEGQVLMELDKTQASGSLEETQEQYFSLIAKSQRLNAIVEGAAMQKDVSINDPDYEKYFKVEKGVYDDQVSTLNNQLSLIDIKIDQKKGEIASFKKQLTDLKKKVDTLEKQAEMNRRLAKTGVASKAELLRAEGELASAKSDYDEVQLKIPSYEAEVSALANEREKDQLAFRQKSREELADVNAKLGVAGATKDRRSDVVNRTSIRSNVEGVVKRLYIDSLGGVVKPGMPIAEIVPIDDQIIIEAKVQPKDIGFVQQGMPARVRISAFNFSMYGGLDGKVDSISADTIVDEKGRAFYLVRIRVEGQIKGHDDKVLRVIPGMQATVDITVARRSAFVYLFNPLLKIFK